MSFRFDFVTCGKLSIDLRGRQVFCGATNARLSQAEFNIVATLAESLNETLPRQEILNRVYGAIQPEPKILDVLVCKARKKLCRAADGENYLETVWGTGYKLATPH